MVVNACLRVYRGYQLCHLWSVRTMNMIYKQSVSAHLIREWQGCVLLLLGRVSFY